MASGDGAGSGAVQAQEKQCEKAKGSSGRNAAAGEQLLNAARCSLVRELRQILETKESSVVDARDPDGRTPLHFAAGYGNEEVVDALLGADAPPAAVDTHGDTPLHLAAAHGHPMAAYALSKAAVGAVMLTNSRGQTPVDVAALCQHHEVLNAMLLGCAGEIGPESVEASKAALGGGAVPDTWAPNGSSALMLAAAADSGPGCQALLDGAATLELADALGRTALMFAAGNNACNALAVLLAAGASVAARDRRGRCVLEYAPSGSKAYDALSSHLATLQKASDAMQAKLLESLEKEEEEEFCKKKGSAAAGSKAAKKAAKKKRRVQASTLPPSVPEADEAVPAGNAGSQADDEASGADAAAQAAAAGEPAPSTVPMPHDSSAAAAAADRVTASEAYDSKAAAAAAEVDVAASQPRVPPPEEPPDAPSGACSDAVADTAAAVQQQAVTLSDRMSAWIQPEQPAEEWHTVGVKALARRGRRSERSASQERPRTPSSASINSAGSTTMRNVEIISGRRQGSALSLHQLIRRRLSQVGADSRQASDDGVSLDGSERSSAIYCSGAAGNASSGRTCAPLAPAAAASLSAPTPSMPAPAAEPLTWAHRVAGIKPSPAASAAAPAASPASQPADAAESTPAGSRMQPPQPTAHAAGTSAPQDQLLALTAACALSQPNATQAAQQQRWQRQLPGMEQHLLDLAWPQQQQQETEDVSHFGNQLPVGNKKQQQQQLAPDVFAPLLRPGFSSPIEPGTPPQREGASPAPDSPTTRLGHCPRCAAARAEADAALCGAAAMHQRMSALERQVKELMTAAANVERAHRAQLDAVLQDAAAHEAAAVAAALAIATAGSNVAVSTAPSLQPTGDVAQLSSRPQLVHRLQPNGKLAVAIVNSSLQQSRQQSQLTPEQVSLLRHPGPQAPSKPVERGSLTASRLSQLTSSAPFSLFGGSSTASAAPASYAPHALLYDASPSSTTDALHSIGGSGLSAADLPPRGSSSGGRADFGGVSAVGLAANTGRSGDGLSGTQLLHGFGGVIGGRDADYGFASGSLAMSGDMGSADAYSLAPCRSSAAAPAVALGGDSPLPQHSGAVGSTLRPIGSRPLSHDSGASVAAAIAADAAAAWYPLGRQARLSAATRTSLDWPLLGGHAVAVLPGSA